MKRKRFRWCAYGYVREAHSRENEVAELAGACLDYWGVVVPDEDVAGDVRRYQPDCRRRHRYYRLGVAPQGVLDWYDVACCLTKV